MTPSLPHDVGGHPVKTARERLHTLTTGELLAPAYGSEGTLSNGRKRATTDTNAAVSGSHQSLLDRRSRVGGRLQPTSRVLLPLDLKLTDTSFPPEDRDHLPRSLPAATLTNTSILGDRRSAPIEIPVCKPPTSQPVTPLTGRAREKSFGYFFPPSPKYSHGPPDNSKCKSSTPSPDSRSQSSRHSDREQFILSPINRSNMKGDRGGAAPFYTPSSPLSPTMPDQSVPATRKPTARPSFSSQQGRRQPAPLAIPSLPVFHPANYESRNASPRSSRPSSSSHGPQISDAQKKFQEYQRDLVASYTRNAVRNTGKGPVPQPSSPRLDPLNNPGPITPLTLEGQSDYFVAGSRTASTPASKGNERREIVERLIGLERERRRHPERVERHSPAPLLCEAPVRSDEDLEKEPSGPYSKLFSYATFKYHNWWFPGFGYSRAVDPGKGVFRHDHFFMSARDPREEYAIAVSMSDRDDNGDDLPNGLAWAMWGIIDGHAGPYTAGVVRKLLPDYVVDELFIRAGLNPRYPYRDSRYIFQNHALQDIVQAIKDAFQRLDNDLLKKAGQAITGSKPLHVSMRDIAPAESGACALLATYDTASRYLFVANVGNSRAVLGQRNDQGTWEARPLSVEHTCHNQEEVARLRAEHPNETEMIQDGRLLGSAVTRAFGDLRWKISAKLQSIARARFLGHPQLPSFLSPPYITAEPSISTTKIDPNDNGFLILASDGFWDYFSSEQAVELVGRWLETNDPSKSAKTERTADAFDVEFQDEALQKELVVRKPDDVPIRGREYPKVKRGDERHWVVMDDNAATHLARNALGGADEDMFCGLVGSSKMYPMRRLRDDITIGVIFFGYGDFEILDPNLTDEDASPSDTLDLS
ncbi:MAG: hypothetical protein Q9213_007332 [Squamulea squamosa]